MNTARPCRCRRTAIVALLVLAGCEGGPTEPGSPDSDEPTAPSFLRFEIIAGDNQVGPAAAALPEPFSIRVTDERGQPAPGVWVRWTSSGGSPSPTRSATDSAGVASTRLTLGAWAGVQTTVAQPDGGGLSGASPEARFTSVALVQGAVRISPTTDEDGNRQTDTVLATLPAPFRVLVQDHNDTPIAGVVVQWSVAGGGSLSSHASTTDSIGVAMVDFTLGAEARQHWVAATVPGLIGSPVMFSAMATPGAVTRLTLLGPDERMATVNSSIPAQVRATDDYGNGAPGVEVSWAATSGDGFVYPFRSTTDSIGVATSLQTLGPFEGPQTATAAVDGPSGSASLAFTSIGVSAIVRVVSGWECYYYCDYYYGSSDPYFSPATTLVKAGRTVAWGWDDGQEHDVVFEDDPTEPTSSPVQRSGWHTRTFLTPGTYRYRCTLHSKDFAEGMVGQVIVLE